RLERQGSGVFAEFGRITVTYSANEYAAFPSTDHRLVSVAKLGSRLDQRIEHGLQVESRTADDLKHVGCGGLLLEGCTQIARAGLHLVKQPHVLDRDHRLIGEGLDQLDLLVGKRPYGAS